MHQSNLPRWIVFAMTFGIGSTSTSLKLVLQEPGSSDYSSSLCKYKQYAALGDSYAAGVNSDPSGELPICNGSNYPNCTTEECRKNEGAYSWQFNEKFKLDEYQFLACSGANTTDCLIKQVPKITPRTDLLTINIGGNDNRAFSSVVRDCVYFHDQLLCAYALDRAKRDIKNIGNSLNKLFETIQRGLEDGSVFVLGYVQFWPTNDVPSQCESENLKRPCASEKAFMNSLVLFMNNVLKSIATQHNFTFVDVDGSYEGHRLCDSGQTWIQWDLEGLKNAGRGKDFDLYNHGVFHPTFEGQHAYEQALEAATGCHVPVRGPEEL